MPCLLRGFAPTGKRANGSLRVWPSGKKKGKCWQGNGSSLSCRLCLSTERHWWVPEHSLEQTNGVGPYVSPKRRSSRNNTSMEMTRRRCNPGLPVRLAPSRSACGTFQIRQDNKQWLSLHCFEAVFDRVVKIHNVCSGSSISLRPLMLTSFRQEVCRVDGGKTCCSGSCNAVRIGSDLIISGWLIISTKHANICCSHRLFTDV